jgi:hypothetical protein
MTDLGALDVLGSIEQGLRFDDLCAHAIEIELGGHTVKVLSLAEIVRHKRASSHPKDKLVLPVLEEALRQILGDA